MLIYSLLLTVVFVVLSPLFLLRRKKYAAGFRERLGNLPSFDAEGQPVIWLHCVSVGEAQAARPLVKALRERFPEYRLVISTTTLTGQRLAREIFKNEAALIFYFPFDWKFSVRRALNRIKPDLVLLMETEIWFNFIVEARKRQAKIAIVNGRLSEKSARGYRRFRRILRGIFAHVNLALMQTAEDAERLKSIGAENLPIKITGNIKFDLTTERAEDILSKKLGERFGVSVEKPLIIAASTHSPEEEIVLSAFEQIRATEAGKNARLMLVPRHPERFEEVAELISKSRWRSARRSASDDEERDKNADVILLDSIGELRAAYQLAEIVFVGGSLIPHGGQSILEPAAFGHAPIVTGIYTMNFAQIVKKFLENNALITVSQINPEQQAKEMAEIFLTLLENPEDRKSMAVNAAQVVASNRGAVTRTIEDLALLLTGKPLN